MTKEDYGRALEDLRRDERSSQRAKVRALETRCEMANAAKVIKTMRVGREYTNGELAARNGVHPDRVRRWLKRAHAAGDYLHLGTIEANGTVITWTRLR